ncbi:UDP-3-O-(3-hydroxymyristoyl)glucosamine N-acyltransferase [Marivirga harenae]|uniref:UDP-3-O-(3-hydroxymyristoyl)glucosamine N-acyltransferase n=1 Tax=Marivirga harenae TaxID=2010992 RepID=UPI0026E06634|nr:UDP-3-O-(3-hydroxymyristoyl)glucosamine N-acyltransferase [Marivirga harenae]WKV10784.1 UDP-3-O-(3-hydroxymyristoyl)glucosamine N-acyltransferase [Marivirga harenae]|tara:strand:- start:45800 stop:46849 length:1050 start_codon:yes stop_codon:yes gene_type:complete
MEFSVNQIAQIIGGKVEGDGERMVDNLGKIEEGKAKTISFLSNDKYENYIYESDAAAIIVKNKFNPKKTIKPALIRVDDPYSAFTQLLEEYNKIMTYAKSGVEEPSFMGENSVVGEGHYRGAFSYIGHNVKIGKNVKIYPQAHIGDNVVIGDNTVIFQGVKIYPDSKIGSNCNIQAGSVIGSDGFGFAPQEDGTYKTIPQLGNVVLEDNVSIGANTTIDCATLGSTIIRKGAKIDNLVQIAHNVEIGENTVIASQAGISGSTKIGKNCVLAGQVGIVGHIDVADYTTISAKSGVSKSVRQSNTVISGTVGFEHKQYLKAATLFKRLPELHLQVQQLEKIVLNLPTEKKS